MWIERSGENPYERGLNWLIRDGKHAYIVGEPGIE